MIKTFTPTTGSTEPNQNIPQSSVACPKADTPSAAKAPHHTAGQPSSPSGESSETKANLPVIIAKLEQCPVDQLIPYPNNPRTHSKAQVRQIVSSIREFGFINPLLIAADHTVIAGHGRLRAARQLNMQAVPVIVLDHLTEQQCRALAIVDNQLPLNAEWDEEMLRRELALLQAEAYNLDLLGFDEAELKRVLAACDDTQELADAEAIPAVPEVPVCAVGDLWILGEHRLLCGDATRREALDTVLAGRTG
jgi:ParB-like chromosome segregation protein Spo0J